MLRNTPTLAESIRGLVRAQLAGVYTAWPAKITEYDADTQRCSAQPLVQLGYTDEAGDRQAESLPVVTDAPISFPGSGDYGQTWPISVGDVGLLVFTSCSLDLWLAKGGMVDPRDERRNVLSDAVFIPGIRPFNAPVGGGGHADGALVIRGPEIRIGGADGTQQTFMADTFMNALNTLIAGITAYVANFATPNPGTSGPAATAWATVVTNFATAIQAGAKTSVVKVK